MCFQSRTAPGHQGDQPPAVAPFDGTGALPGPTDNAGPKGPGHGWTLEFYKAFRDILSQDILEVFIKSLTTSSLPLSCRRVVPLLPKKGNVHYTKNWCPVLLLCTDYKILSQALAVRLKEALEQSSTGTRRTVYLAAQWSASQPHLGCFGVLHFIGGECWSSFFRPRKGF